MVFSRPPQPGRVNSRRPDLQSVEHLVHVARRRSRRFEPQSTAALHSLPILPCCHLCSPRSVGRSSVGSLSRCPGRAAPTCPVSSDGTGQRVSCERMPPDKRGGGGGDSNRPSLIRPEVSIVIGWSASPIGTQSSIYSMSVDSRQQSEFSRCERSNSRNCSQVRPSVTSDWTVRSGRMLDAVQTTTRSTTPPVGDPGAGRE